MLAKSAGPCDTTCIQIVRENVPCRLHVAGSIRSQLCPLLRYLRTSHWTGQEQKLRFVSNAIRVRSASLSMRSATVIAVYLWGAIITAFSSKYSLSARKMAGNLSFRAAEPSLS